MTATPSTSGTAFLTSQRKPRSEFKFSKETFDVDDSDNVYELEEIISLTWNIYGVSVLFGFRHNDKTVLKLYGKCLREEVAANLPQENVTYNANVSVTKNVLMPDFMCIPAIKVDVYAKKIDQEDSIEKSIYRGILFSWKTNSNSNSSNSIKLPLLLCRGTRSCMKVVHSTLSRMFDCLIIKLPIEEDDLIWLLPIIIIPMSKEEYPSENEEVRLEYTVPGLPVTDTITITLYSSDLVEILNVIIKNPHNETSAINLTLEHVKKFRKCLRAHILKVAGLQLGLCTLHRINVSVGALMNNKMKISNPETMKRVLLYITEKASKMFHTILF